MRRGCVAGWWQDREEAVEEEAAAAADGWHDQAPPISPAPHPADSGRPRPCASAWASALDFGPGLRPWTSAGALRSEEHTSELQSLMRISYAVFCLKKKPPQRLT